jgi:hypothetical protein
MQIKRRIEKEKQAGMSLLSLCGIVFCFAAVACSHDIDVPTEQKEISMGVKASGVAARAAITTEAELDEIGVFGYYTATERWIWSANNAPTSLKADYFLNKIVEKTSGAWTYAPPKYWPPDTRNKLSFFAYAPYVETNDLGLLTPGPLTPYPCAKTETGQPYLTYIVPEAAIDQLDVLWDSRIDMSKDEAPVFFDMNHALTRISFSAALHPDEVAAFPKKQYKVTVTKISVSGVDGCGTLSLLNGAWTPYTPAGEDKAEYELTTTAGDIETEEFDAQSATVDPRPLTKPDTYLMLIPQTIEDGATLNFTLSITIGGTTTTSGLSVPIKPTNPVWTAGQAIDYKLLIKGEFISIVTNLTPWTLNGDGTGGVNF